MHAQTLLALLPAVAMAQYGYGSDDAADSSSMTTTASAAAASSSSSASGTVHVVKVGDGGLTFSPNDVKAAVGDTVEFHFYPKAHSVAQSSFDKPCEPLSNGTATGFFSGPVPVSSGEGADVFSVKVEDASPKWFYCATAQHCQGGMVGVINAPSSGGRTVDAYKEAAAKAEKNVAPASTGGGTLGPAATGSPSSSGGSGTSASGTSAVSGTAASGSASASRTSSPSAGIEARGDVRLGLLSFGMAVAGVVGGLLI
ncbi:putative GPI-anchored cupredoxin [Colletotrichum gloeosporioides]|uniref:Putative GPI-anchored cupredoxin n=1 Tax=Colletotrichum gloeosporioides TaxID=474922 RepID=A0A8H4FIU6_COLGL|nr:putative GPI-anchored cupredoxin [Colletotrichum gloeosporioides]KAF3802579.1 putative GPI-anchored cupredoxin [Colletotrichum gloeosporioides]